MTRKQFAELEPGDRVSWRGADPEEGIVLANGSTLIVEWDRSGMMRYGMFDFDLFELAPSYIEQVTR